MTNMSIMNAMYGGAIGFLLGLMVTAIAITELF